MKDTQVGHHSGSALGWRVLEERKGELGTSEASERAMRARRATRRAKTERIVCVFVGCGDKEKKNGTCGGPNLF
jgi:hypothetical protein